MIDDDALRAAVEAHRADIRAKGETCFSRRRVILIADLFGMKPMPMVWQMEKPSPPRFSAKRLILLVSSWWLKFQPHC